MKYKILLCLSLITIACKKEEGYPKIVSMDNCIAKCIDSYTKEYMRNIYGTNDRFVDQFYNLCELKYRQKVCIATGLKHFGEMTYRVIEGE